MTSTEHDETKHGRARKIAGFLATRLLALAVFGLIVFLAFGDVGSLFRRAVRSPVTPVGTARDEDAGPGWPHRRGPTYDGHSSETDLADHWPAEGPPLLWSQPCGRGYSGVIVVAGRLFTQTQSLTSQDVECRDAATGELLWRHGYAWPYEPAGMYPGPRATPTWHEGRIYFAGPDGQIGCLDANTGKRIWLVNVNERFDGRGTGFGYSCSPLVEDGKVILPVGGEGASVVALNAENGSTVWASGSEKASYCSALPIDFEGRRCVVAFLQNALALFDLKTGRELALEVFSSGYDEHAAAPLYREPLLMVASPFRAGAACYRLERQETTGATDGAIKLTPVWTNRQFSNDTASSLLVDGQVYGFDLREAQAKAQRPSRGTYKCLDFSMGEVLWETDKVGHATGVAADGKLFLLSDAGELILARANPEHFEPLGRSQIFQDEICWTPPALDCGRLYLRSPSELVCVYVGRPERLNVEPTLASRPALGEPASDWFDLAWFVAGEREYAFDPADLAELSRWFFYCVLGVLIPASLAGVSMRFLVATRWPQKASGVGWAVFWTTAFLLGIAGTALFNRWFGPFVFTWPVCLFVAHQVALNTIVAVNRSGEPNRGKWRSLAVAAFFLAVCLGYYLACRRLSLATEWTFLIGFLPSWPIAIPTAYRLTARPRPVVDVLCVLLSYALFFWTVGAVLLWKGAVG